MNSAAASWSVGTKPYERMPFLTAIRVSAFQSRASRSVLNPRLRSVRPPPTYTASAQVTVQCLHFVTLLPRFGQLVWWMGVAIMFLLGWLQPAEAASGRGVST